MSRYEERDSKLVYLLDKKRTETAALKVFAAQFGKSMQEVRHEGWGLAYDLVFTEVEPVEDESGYTPEQQWAVICTEGVGWRSQPDQRILIPLMVGYSGSNTVDLSWRLLRDIAVNPGDKPMKGIYEPNLIDFKDHVRTFGERLESNFWLWNSRIIEALPVPVKETA